MKFLGADAEVDLLAVYAAVVASVLAVLRLSEWRQARQRLHFTVYSGEIFSEDPAMRDRPHEKVVVIAVGNRAPFPIHVTQIAFALRRGSALMQLNPPLGSPTLPKRLEPSEGLSWVMVPENVRAALGRQGVNEIRSVIAYDGSGRKYARGLTRRERRGLAELLGPEPRRSWWGSRWGSGR